MALADGVFSEICYGTMGHDAVRVIATGYIYVVSEKKGATIFSTLAFLGRFL